MKNNNYVHCINKSFILMLALTLFICSAMLFLCNLEKNKVYADYETDILSNPNAVVNFNQLISNSYIEYHNFDTTGINWVMDNYEMQQNHKFYLHFKASNSYNNTIAYRDINNTWVTLVDIDQLQSSTYSGIFTCNVDMSRFYIYVRMAPVTISNFILIDLTKMFGVGNEPSVTQCQELFIADYYAYNSSTPVSLSGLNSYAEGVASVYGNAVTLGPQYFYNNINEIRFNDITGGYAKYIDMNNYPNYSFNIDDHVLFSLPTTITSGTNIKLSFYLGRSEYNDNTPLEIGYFIQSQFYSLTRVTATAQFDNYNFFELDLIAPYDINGIVFNIPRDYSLSDPDSQWYSVMVGDISLTYYITSLQQLISEATTYGYEKYKSEVDSYYQIGGEGYETIYQSGVRDSQSNMAVFSDAWAFIGTAFSGIGDLLKLELFPNVPIGLFVAFPLLLGLIFFIVKLTKGGGN